MMMLMMLMVMIENEDDDSDDDVYLDSDDNDVYFNRIIHSYNRYCLSILCITSPIL
jgi:hypothetical protein